MLQNSFTGRQMFKYHGVISGFPPRWPVTGRGLSIAPTGETADQRIR